MKHHLIIGGTGRAGTTFLVQYLDGCGLDTHISHHADHRAHYDENANAGLEDVPLGDADAPYVLKSPWLYEYVERLLARDDIAVDAVILPMRGIVEAATSRTLNELRARAALDGLPQDCLLWETWGTTPGGTVFSLNPIDQARLLALGFHELLHKLVQKDIPVVMLDFPRFIEDPAYLCAKLLPVLGGKVSPAHALDVHRRLADPAKVRVGRDLAVDAVAAGSRGQGAALVHGPAFPEPRSLDRIALRRELDRRGARIGELERQVEQLKHAGLRRWMAAPMRGALQWANEGFRRFRRLISALQHPA
ncbi:hypothetical protein [Variovorax sp. dw_308]|uniref:hypothetical protein n=1 Tax=Variovorax sp. dw_308 TaxID=2721546 RepID=UPI001C44F28D|nr:hypothetical protein [Variovorax sp. dw_308]